MNQKDSLESLKMWSSNISQIGKHDKMGINVVPLKDLPPDEVKVLTLPLLKKTDSDGVENEKDRGQVVVELKYKPFKEDEIPKGFGEMHAVPKAPDGTPAGGGLLVVIIHEAEDVEGKHHTNPFVRIYFRGDKRKTKVHVNQCNFFIHLHRTRLSLNMLGNYNHIRTKLNN